PVVKKVYPSADTLPENLLRMYIQFSKPMKTIDNLEKIKLVDEKEQEIVGAIFNNVHELWDKEQKQLTIIFDPSRVKTGLDANERMGRALQAGKTYQLVIGQLEDVEGNTLPSVFTKSFYVSEEDQIIPNTALWTLKIPKSGSTSPLIIEFPAMLDHLSLLQRLQITNSNNQPIAGKIEIAKQETEWRFTPTEKWETGDYILYIHGRLEDPCGNNLNGLFDHKIGSLKNEKEEFIESINIKISK
ncbi:MAG: hypothetical protein AAF849_15225, partial [Bacteroidota bacterium]